MEQIHVDFRIDSSEASQSFQTTGTYDNNQLIFHDPTNHTHTITLYSNHIVYQKVGDTTLFLTLNMDAITEAHYEAMQQTFHFQVHTKDIIVMEQLIDVVYELYQENQCVNQTHFTLHYQPMKEDQS